MNIERSTVKVFVARFGAAVLYFLGITFFARELGPAVLGSYFLFQALLGLLSIPADFGLRGALEKRISEGTDRGTFLTSAIALKLVPLTAVVGIVYLAQETIDYYLGAELALLLALAIVLRETALLTLATLKGELRVGETASIEITHHVTWVGLGVLFTILGFGVLGLVYGLLAGFSLQILIGWYKRSVVPGLPSVEHARSLVEYGQFSVISDVGGYTYNWMDVAIIGLYLTQAEVSAYELAWRVTAVVALFSNAISIAIFPQVSEWDAADSKARIEALITRVLTPSLFFVIPAFFGALLFSRELLGFIFGPEYTIAWLVLILLMGDKVFQAIQVIVGRSLQAIDKPKLAAKATIVSVVLNVVLNFALIPEFGILGAAVATVISSLTNDLLHLWYLKQYIRVRFPWREIGECFGAALVMAGLLYAYTSYVPVDGLVQLLVAVTLGGVLYVTVALSLPNSRVRIRGFVRDFGA